MKNFGVLQNIGLSNNKLRQSFILLFARPLDLHDKRRNYNDTSFEEISHQDVKAKRVLKEEDLLIKYRNVIKKLPSSVGEPTDIYHKTNFGSIRFDEENTPVEYFKENSSSTKSSDETDTTFNNRNINFIDKCYFESSLENCDKLTAPTEISEKSLDKPYSKTTFKSLEDNLDLNYIDSQYLSNNSKIYDNIQVQNISTEDIDGIDMNSVDKQYFANNSLMDPMISNGHESFNESLIKNKLLIENDNLVSSDLYSFAQAIDEDFELPLVDSSSNLKTYKLSNRSQLEADLLTLSGSLSVQKSNKNILKQNILKQNNKENLSTEVNSTINQDKNIKKVTLSNEYDNNKQAALSFDAESSSTTQNAFEYVIKKRREEIMKQQGVNNELTNKFKKILKEVPVYKGFLKYDFVQLLRKSIIYNDNDVIAIFKPYGVPIHGGDKDKYGKRSDFTIVDALPDLANLIKTEQIIPVHRLDVNTTGVLLLAKSYTMADTLKKLFMDQKIKKSYLAITKGIPSPVNGVINIPISEGKIENHIRMVLRPDIPGFRGKSGKSRQAITHFKVLSRANNSALVMLNPISGIKHQLRVHLGFGLACPVLGDHKYSHLKKMLPQKLPGDMLDHLQIKQTRVRDLPMYLHAFSVTIPNILETKDLFIRVGPPKFFKTTMRCLELNKSQNHLNEVPELIFDTAY